MAVLIPAPMASDDLVMTTNRIVSAANTSISQVEYTNATMVIAVLSLMYDLTDAETIMLHNDIYRIISGWPGPIEMRDRMIERIYEIKGNRG